MMRRLGFVLDAVGALRAAGRGNGPDPVAAAAVAEMAGVSEIAVHLRGDRQHIQERDIRLLRQTAQTKLDVRMAPTQEMLKLAYDMKPDSVTLMSEHHDALSVLGLDVHNHRDHIRKYVQSLRDGDIGVCLFIDPDLDQVKSAHRVDAQGVVFDARKFCEARDEKERELALERLMDAARTAAKVDLQVAVGGGLALQTTPPLLAIPDIETFFVGHSVIERALFVGLDRAIRDMLAQLAQVG